MFAVLALVAIQKQALKLPALFSDNMVLQREMPVPIFGTANPSEPVTIQLGDQALATRAGADGKWLVRTAPMKAGGPLTAVIQTPYATLTLKNLMVGEVWICSGQSNMEFHESAASDYAQAQEEADPAIRMFTVSQVASDQPISEARGKWIPSSRLTVGGFSAVGLAFGRELHNALNVPIGLINASWGGTKAESWISRDALSANEVLRPIVSAYLQEFKDFPQRNALFHSELREWIATRADTGNEGFLNGWANRTVDESTWNKVNLPGTIDTMEPSEEGKNFDGAVWFRRTFEIPESWLGKALRLDLGPIADYDDTYVNGTKVGLTKVATEDASKVPRSYRIAPGILLQGPNSVAIRVYAAQGSCGFTGFPDEMKVVLDDDASAEPVPLAGEWRERVERKVDTSTEAPHLPLGPGNPKTPGSLFNGMIAPLIPYGMKGVIWYQGESDVEHAEMYRVLFPTLIRDWHQRWNEGSFPFYFVQLPNYKPPLADPSDTQWAQLREAQASVLKSMLYTSMATTIDLGDPANIHPKNKREVGRRLAAIALSKNYGQHVAWRGPEFHYLIPSRDSIRVFFQHAEDGLKTSDGKAPVGFEIAGDDQRFYPATARIEGTAIVLSNSKVTNPVAVRYGWADSPDLNLFNSDGLPATPFRTDDWPPN